MIQPTRVSYHDLNAMLNLYGPDGRLQLEKDREAARAYFLEHVNQNTVFFHTLDEKLEYLFTNDYYEREPFEKCPPGTLGELYSYAYSLRFRFSSFLGAFKFYTSYALKTFDGSRYLERFEDRVTATAVTLADGDVLLARRLINEIISGRYQPATPTFLNAGKKQRGELVSCFELEISDNMNSIGRAINSALQLSKRGGGVAFLLTNIRESGAPIKQIENQSSGIIPIMKLLEDSFSYANQLGARQGAGAVYISAHHPDILSFMDTKRENADEKIRIKSLSLGIMVPDITFELAKRDEDMYLFSPYDVQRETGRDFAELSVTEHYYDWLDNKNIRKKKINARQFFQTIAELQFESGYPYIVFEDTVNRHNPISGRVKMSNLCSEVLQVSTPSVLNDDQSFSTLGEDISCNLGSMNIAKAMDEGDLGSTVEAAVRALTYVSDNTHIEATPTIANGNAHAHAIGLGQMNLHGFLARERIHYGSPEGIDFTSRYFYAITYHALRASCQLAKERGRTFAGFETSAYADGTYFEKYLTKSWVPETVRVKALFEDFNVVLPTQEDWAILRDQIVKHGIYNRYLQAVPPTGSISYINHSTSSIHPVAAAIEIRKEGKLGRVYYPAPYLSDETLPYFKDAYEIGPEAIIDTYAAATEHVDQGLSLTLFFPDTATTRDINRAQIYAWRKGIKSLYYVRLRQAALEGTEVEGCVSCTL